MNDKPRMSWKPLIVALVLSLFLWGIIGGAVWLLRHVWKG